MQHYIYKITCVETGEYYYGKRSAPDWETDSYMGSGILLKNKMTAYPEYQWKKEVLLLLDSSEEAYEYEAVVIGEKYYGGKDYDGLCLNLTVGGAGGSAPGASEKELAEREERTRRLLDGDDLSDLRGFEMANDNLQQYVFVHNTPHNLSSAKKLLQRGWYIGKYRNYTRIKFSELGLSQVDAYQESFIRGEVPEGVSKFSFINHELKQMVYVNNNPRTLEIVQKLLRGGWQCGFRSEYEKIPLRSLNLSGSNYMEELFLSGKNCPGVVFSMNLGDTYVIFFQQKRKKNAPFHPGARVLYNKGWRFGYSTHQRKVKVSDLIK